MKLQEGDGVMLKGLVRASLAALGLLKSTDHAYDGPAVVWDGEKLLRCNEKYLTDSEGVKCLDGKTFIKRARNIVKA